MIMFRPQVFIFLIFLAGGALAAAADQPPAPQKSQSATKSPAGNTVIFIDPATGKTRQPDASEIGALTKTAPATTMAAPKAPEPALLQGPGGAVGVQLGEDHESYAVASITPDGKVAVDCVTGAETALKRIAVNPDPKAKDPRDARVPR